MSKQWLGLIIRTLLYLLMQVIVLKEIHLGTGEMPGVAILVYPVVLLTLPLQIPQFFILLLSFCIGSLVDLFYLSPGVHAGACLWMMLFRPLALRLLEPKNGYPTDAAPTISDLGVVWFSQYAGMLLVVFFLSYFILKVFTFVYIGQILLGAILSLFVSGIIIFLLQLFFSFRS
ncbi:MAG: hypothetical protein IT266_02005 [Saprospiraceae bacterium]|nr:hypothetical protein [Saprospiraceae bacterium]